MGEDHIGFQGDQLFCERLITIWAIARKAIVDPEIMALSPPAPFKPFPKSCQPFFRLRIILGQPHKDADTPHSFALRACRDRQRGNTK